MTVSDLEFIKNIVVFIFLDIYAFFFLFLPELKKRMRHVNRGIKGNEADDLSSSGNDKR